MNRKLNRLSLLALALLGSLSGVAHAQEASPLSFNASVTSDYRYRGISQTRFKPAFQAGVDYAANGFYVGAWGSTIKWIKDNSTDTVSVKGPVELDLYGGYKGAVGDVAYDVGFLRYEYLNNTLDKRSPTYVNANTNEVYGAVTYGLFTAKYSHAISNLFGTPDSKNSYYLDLSATVDLGDGYSLVPHVGYQKVKNTTNGSYTDYSLTLSKDLGNGLSATGALVDTNADKAFGYATPAGKFTGKSTVVVGLKYTF